MDYLKCRSPSKMAFHKRVILQRAPYENSRAMFDNAANTRFVYDAIMHIFACNNDWDLCITPRTLYN